MSKFIPVVILSAILLAGCGLGILPKSSLPIIGGGEHYIGGSKTIHMKNGDEAHGVTYYLDAQETYHVSGKLYKKGEKEGKDVWQLMIPASEVLYIE